ncbi:Tetratricopeptide repeat (TPR)-like superfamily protein [Melia azedarach]|uniref:Tetratricopeptide repeat (TPR)-like superfamily protein n=1 Tax=Melia azedarach TaxID=155640 RepID=A0ACC1XA70_MELAZ|nr:Tetratricopeptide repeat (TPR)-like superfamily protein [Melia azedarach]
MFSIAAINDTDSRGQWEPLAPTKEAQEFHLSQTYHEGLHKLQSKEYDKAQELLESVLKDPLISTAQVLQSFQCNADGKASDGHLLQLRFLALKNLAAVFLQQGSCHYESALRCYLQAVEIDTKDSVVWNQLGTLACSMGLLSISRWAFEQGLLCSPNNWNCMEKLLEVLIAIGDEVACLSVAELILRHWPSHSRALNVKSTIEESEPVPYAPRGIDKLEPKHVRLKFIDKRKATDENIDEGVACKKMNQNIEICLAEASWVALADALLEILLPLNGCGPETGVEKSDRSGDVRLAICLPSSSEIIMGLGENRANLTGNGEIMPLGECNSERNISKEKEANLFEEQPLERRSTRLERLRSRKPGKEEADFATDKDLDKNVLQFLESFIIGRSGTKDCDHAIGCFVSCPDHANSYDTECSDVTLFVRETSNNFGAYHMSHLLLEHAASRSLMCHDAFVKFLELEKLTRHWGLDRTPECSIFLAELYYDLGSSASNISRQSEFISEASYHLCKIVESVSLDYSFHLTNVSNNGSYSSKENLQGINGVPVNIPICQDSFLDSSILTNKSSFWVRYFWLSGRLSLLDDNKSKAYEQFCISLSLLEKTDNMDDSPRLISLPHCRIVKELTIGRILHEINLLQVDFLLEKPLCELIEKEMYLECVTMLAPLLFSTKDVHLDLLPIPAVDKKDEEIKSVELSALDILIKACGKTKSMNTEIYLNCHRRKLQILMVVSGMNESLALCKPTVQKSGSQMHSASDMISRENSSKHWNNLVAEEVKAILQCVLQVKNCIDQTGDHNGFVALVSSICDIQSLLLAVMCNVASNFLSKKSCGPLNVDQTDQKQQCCFVDAVTAFCKLQHLNPTVPVKTQVELIVAIHDLLAEYGLCCAGEGGEGEEGLFLKFAIKHLLALNMKLKSNISSSNKEMTEYDKQLSHNSHVKESQELKSDTLDVEMVCTETHETIDVKKDNFEEIASNGMSSHSNLEKGNAQVDSEKCCDDNDTKKGEKNSNELTECGNELAEDEREELELIIDNALDQCFYCLYGLNLRSDSSYEDDLVMHRNTSRGDYQTKEQSADVFQYVLPYARASSRTGLVKLRRVLRAIRKHFPQPPEDVLAGNAIDKFLDDPDLCEDKLSEEAGSDGYLETIMKIIFPDMECIKQFKAPSFGSSEPYLEVYCNLYYYLAQSEEMSTTDKWPGFVLTKEGEEFVQQNANLFKFDLLFNPLRFESWQRLANIYDEEVDLLLNDGSKHINVAGWRKNATLPQRVETSRRRSRRCLLMSLALAKTSAQQCEIHELLALVYYDSLQNVVPFYDQRSVVPSRDAAWKMYCENSLKHFKKAFSHKEDWSYAFYMGKLCEKLGYSHEISLSYYDKAIGLNPSAVDPLYRMHASRLKLLCTCDKHNVEVLKVLSAYSYSHSTKDAAMDILSKIGSEICHSPEAVKDESPRLSAEEKKDMELVQMEEVWRMLYNDCLSALEVCVEGDLKHFHKARYMLAQGLYKRGEVGDLEKAKDELSFCFKSSRSSFTINMWEIDGMVKKGRRKTTGITGTKKVLEVNLPESSRKFITCIRKYLLFYLKLLEETGDVCTLERAYVSLRADKRFSLCVEDLVPVALGRYIRALLLTMHQTETAGSGAVSSSEQKLEKIFSIFMEQGNLWPEICGAPEIKSPEISESSLYGFLHQYIVSLERKGNLEAIEAINEKIRKRFKNPKLSNSNCAKVCRHASVAWCRSLIINLALITPLRSLPLSEIQAPKSTDGGLENSQLLCADLQTNELWNSSFEDISHLKILETKWNPMLSKIKNIIIKKALDGNLDTASSLLRNSYNFYRDSSCATLTSGVSLYLVPSQLATEAQFQPGIDGVETVDVSIPRKLLLWAYTLLQGRYANISHVVKHCEENVKSKMKKGTGTSPVPTNACIQTSITAYTGGAKDHSGGTEAEITAVTLVTPASVAPSSASVSRVGNAQYVLALPNPADSQKSLISAPQLQLCSDNVAERSPLADGGDNQNRG